MESKIFKLSTLVKSDEENVNGIIYTKQEFQKSINKFNEKRSEGKKYYLTTIVEDYQNFYENTKIKPKDIIGEILAVEDGYINIKVESEENLNKLNTLSKLGYKPGMAYIGKVSDGADGKRYVKDIDIVIYEMINPNNTGDRDWDIIISKFIFSHLLKGEVSKITDYSFEYTTFPDKNGKTESTIYTKSYFMKI